MRLQLRGLDTFDVELNLLCNQAFVPMVESEIEGHPGVRSLHAVDVGVHDLSGDVQRQGQFRLQWHFDPEDSMTIQ